MGWLKLHHKSQVRNEVSDYSSMRARQSTTHHRVGTIAASVYLMISHRRTMTQLTTTIWLRLRSDAIRNQMKKKSTISQTNRKDQVHIKSLHPATSTRPSTSTCPWSISSFASLLWTTSALSSTSPKSQRGRTPPSHLKSIWLTWSYSNEFLSLFGTSLNGTPLTQSSSPRSWRASGCSSATVRLTTKIVTWSKGVTSIWDW